MRVYSSSKKGTTYIKLEPSGLELQTIELKGSLKPPKLSFGLDRALFNPGVHFLKDPRTHVYNFDPYLENIMQPEDFEFSLLNDFVPASKDPTLLRLAKMTGSNFISSTSSISPIMSQLYFLISENKEPDFSSLSSCFQSEHVPKGFTSFSKSPLSFIMSPHEGGVRSIVLENYEEEPSILMRLGNVLEKLLTLNKDQFERLKKNSENPWEVAAEIFSYSKAGPLLLRSQLDCHDPRLPRSTFDLKTRCTLPIRMDIDNYQDYLGYHLAKLNGYYESFEREQYDLVRSSLLKYNFQTRIGDMDGIFIAYHNTREIFGLQYMPREEMDRVLYGSVEFGDTCYNFILQALAHLSTRITEKYSDASTIRVTLALSKDNSHLTAFCESICPDQELTGPARPDDFHVFEVRSVSYLNGSQAPVSDITCGPHENWCLYLSIEQVRAEEHEKKIFMAIRDGVLRAAGIGKQKTSNANRRFSSDIYRSIGKQKGPVESEAEEKRIVTGYWTGISTEKAEGEQSSASDGFGADSRSKTASWLTNKGEEETEAEVETEAKAAFETGDEENEAESKLLLHIRNIARPAVSSSPRPLSMAAPAKPRRRSSSKKSTLASSLLQQTEPQTRDNHPLLFEHEHRRPRRSSTRGKDTLS